MNADKTALRRAMRERERYLSEAYRRESSRRIAARLLALPAYRAAGMVCCFAGTPREIDTREILKAVLSDGKRLCVPLCLSPGIMEMRAVESLEELAPGTAGILEPPPESITVPTGEIDFMVVPCLSCDRRGRRLGQGGGYYDRYLRGYDGVAVLVCRERLLSLEIPWEPHDRLVPWVLTERGNYRDGIPV